MKEERMLVAGVVAIVAILGLVFLFFDASRPIPEVYHKVVVVEEVVPPQVQSPWPSAGMAYSLGRCKQECQSRNDLAQDGIAYCVARCDLAYLA